MVEYSEKVVQLLPEKIKFNKKSYDNYYSKLFISNIKNEYFAFLIKTTKKNIYL